MSGEYYVSGGLGYSHHLNSAGQPPQQSSHHYYQQPPFYNSCYNSITHYSGQVQSQGAFLQPESPSASGLATLQPVLLEPEEGGSLGSRTGRGVSDLTITLYSPSHNMGEEYGRVLERASGNEETMLGTGRNPGERANAETDIPRTDTQQVWRPY